MIERALCGVVPLVMASVLVWQVATGKAFGRNGRVWFRRSERPALFWLLIAFQSAATGAAVYIAVLRMR